MTPDATQSGADLQALEERMLFLLLLLRKPRMRVIYVTGRPVPESVVEYYLGLLPGVIPRQARARLHMVATHDGSARPLTQKLLERPRVLAEIRALIPDPTRSHIVPYTTTVLERDLALTLGIPLYGADPVLLPSVRRPAVAGCSRRSGSRIRSATRTCMASTTWSTRWRRCARPSAPSAPRSSSSTTGSPAAATRSSTWAACLLPARPTSAPSSAAAPRRWRSSKRTSVWRTTWHSWRATAASPRSG